jgi:hypothetical protein
MTHPCAALEEAGGLRPSNLNSSHSLPRRGRRAVGALLFVLLVPTACHPQHSRIWHPTPGTTWQWQLTGTVNTSVNARVYDIDISTGVHFVARLHALGHKVLCYFSAGTRESWRSDVHRFPASVVGQRDPSWLGERWLDIRALSVIGPVMVHRLKQCRRRGFDGVEFDNVDGYQQHTGFVLTARDQLTYNRWLAQQAHRLGLAAALKNDLDQIPALVSVFDLAINEQCFQFHECRKLLPFIRANKAVFTAEYYLSPAQFCPRARALHFSSIQKHLQLDAWRQPC